MLPPCSRDRDARVTRPRDPALVAGTREGGGWRAPSRLRMGSARFGWPKWGFQFLLAQQVHLGAPPASRVGFSRLRHSPPDIAFLGTVGGTSE